MLSYAQRWLTRQLAFWLRAFTLGICVLVTAGAAWAELNRHEAALVQREHQAELLARSLAQHAADTFEMADLALLSIARLIGDEPPTRRRLAALRLDMAALVRRVPRIQNLYYYEESGWRLSSSLPLIEAGVNDSRSDFFRHHRLVDDPGLFIGKPVQATPGGPWTISASRRISRSDGSFGGVFVATIDLAYFSDFYAGFNDGEDVRVVLLGGDGTLIARTPRDDATMGMNLSGGSVFQKVKAGEIFGRERMTSPWDGTERLSAFRKVATQPLTVILSVSRDAALVEWRQGLLVRVPIIAAFLGGLIFGGLRLARQAALRQAAEATMAELARRDALTGLLNRRAFDEILPATWWQCLSSGRPLSLLMVDVDCFKAFNDANGHPAGDKCLQIIAHAVQDAVHYPGDRVMRYGGEELAVVLPDTPREQASVVAERIRAAIVDLEVPHPTSSASRCLTVSVGCATGYPAAMRQSDPSKLLDDADRALYEAKRGGRNRVAGSLLAESSQAGQRPLPDGAASLPWIRKTQEDAA